MKLHYSSCTLSLLGALLFPLATNAQDVPAARADIARGATTPQSGPSNAATATAIAPSPGEDAPKLPGDAEYGVQKVLVRRSNWEPWAVGAFAGYSWSTNPALLNDNEIEDSYMQAGVYAAYTPQITGNWFGSVGFGQSFYDYNDLDILDFAQTAAYAGVLYATPSTSAQWLRNTVFSLRYRFEYLTEIDKLSNDFYNDHSIELSAQRTFRITRGQKAYVGLISRWSIDSSVDNAARDEYSGLAGYRLEWTPEIITSFDLRSSIYNYSEVDRTDWNNIISANAEYKFTDWASITTNLGWIINSSDESSFDYNSGTLGAMVNLNVRF